MDKLPNVGDRVQITGTTSCPECEGIQPLDVNYSDNFLSGDELVVVATGKHITQKCDHFTSVWAKNTRSGVVDWFYYSSLELVEEAKQPVIKKAAKTSKVNVLRDTDQAEEVEDEAYLRLLSGKPQTAEQFIDDIRKRFDQQQWLPAGEYVLIAKEQDQISITSCDAVLGVHTDAIRVKRITWTGSQWRIHSENSTESHICSPEVFVQKVV
jgi:hypothetical protein